MARDLLPYTTLDAAHEALRQAEADIAADNPDDESGGDEFYYDAVCAVALDVERHVLPEFFRTTLGYVPHGFR